MAPNASNPRILIIGAGPTGLGAAARLHARGLRNWRVVEASAVAGGLASSVIDTNGFTWDLGGHVLFSHYPQFDRLVNATVTEWNEHEREAWVWIRERWVPYPLQNNLWRLPSADLESCIAGLRLAQRSADSGGAARRPTTTFADWLADHFGAGLCDLFMTPYNRKVWAYDPATLGVGWMRERVAQVDLERVLRNVASQQDDIAWGPNATFRFPRRGGTGAIWTGVANSLPADHFSFGLRAVRVDSRARRVHFHDGSSEQYDILLSTMPLDTLLATLSDAPGLTRRASEFVHSASHIVGIGIEGQPPEQLRTKCWMYFPENSSPFYRCTVFSNYSPYNVPVPGQQWSLLAEVSESPDKPVDASRVVEEVLNGMYATGLLSRHDRIVSRWHTRLPYGYPTPWLGRDAVLDDVHAQLAASGIFSRGRFGAWKYEVSNQDHSMMQGAQVVDHWLDDAPEAVFSGVGA